MNILIVDDDPHMRGMLFKVLTSMERHEVSVLTNGRNAVSLLADPNHGFHLVLMDFKMPRLTGDKVIEVISDVTDTHFIILTGHPEEFPSHLKHVKVVKKPVDVPQIEKLVFAVEGIVLKR